jgi:hypothetical protein
MATKTTSGVPLPTIDPFKLALGGQSTPALGFQTPAPNPFAMATGNTPPKLPTASTGGMSVYNPATAYTAPPKPPVQPVTAITASSLTPQPTPIYPVAQVNPAPQAALAATTASVQEQAAGTATNPTEPAPAPIPEAPASTRGTVLDRILGFSEELAGKGEATLLANEQAGVNAKNQLVTDLTNQYRAKEREYDKQIRAIERSNPQGTGAEVAAAQIADITRNKNQELADIAIQQSAAIGNYTVAKEIAEQAVAAKYEPIQAQIDLLKTYYTLSADDLTESEKLTAQEKIQERQAAVDFDRQKELYEYKQKIDQSDPLYQANLANVYSTIAARNAEALGSAGTGVMDVNQLSGNGYSAAQNNGAAITALLKNNNVGQGTRTQLANVLGVVNAAEELANNNIEGKFEGINPLTGILNAKIPFTQVGLPFRETVKSEAQIQNEGYIEAINLRTQIWASGASLTNEQINQVNRFTPRVTDTDASVQAKLNNLANFMLNQTKTQLQSEGIDFTPAKVDLFETAKLIKEASPEQRKELREAGLIK